MSHDYHVMFEMKESQPVLGYVKNFDMDIIDMTYRRKDVWTSKTRNKLVKPVYRPTRIIIIEANTHTAHTQTSSDHKTHTRSTEKEKKEKKRFAQEVC